MTQTSLTENKFSFLSLTCCLSLTNLFACTSPTFSDSFVNCRQTLVPRNAALSTHRHKLRAAVFSVKKKKSGHQHICLYLEINTIFESSQRNRPAKQFPTLDSALRFCTVPNPR